MFSLRCVNIKFSRICRKKALNPHTHQPTESTLKSILKNIYEMFPHTGSGTATDVIIREYDDFHDNYYNRLAHCVFTTLSVQ